MSDDDLIRRGDALAAAADLYRWSIAAGEELEAAIAALTAALDPALSERAGEVLPRLRKADEYEPLGHDGWEAADLITTLLAQNAALRAELDRYLRHLTAGAESLNAYKARAEAAEAREKRLREAMIQMRDDKTGFRHAVHFRRFITAALKGNDQ